MAVHSARLYNTCGLVESLYMLHLNTCMTLSTRNLQCS